MSEWAIDKIDELYEQITILKAERDEAKDTLNRLSTAFENAMVLVKQKLQTAYVCGWTAGRVVDERVTLGANQEADVKMFMEALASFRRWDEEQAKKS